MNIEINSKYIKEFVSDDITDKKYKQLYNFAVLFRNIKNNISNEINYNILLFLNMSKFEFISYMRTKYPKSISSYFEESLYTHVYTCYHNKFDAIHQKIKFTKRIFKSFNLYKRNTKDHKKGDLKSVSYINENTPLSITLTYLARYGNENIIDYIKGIYDTVEDENKKKLYDNILYCVNKFGFDRLYQLALRKRNRIIKKYTKEPIEFKSLTFSGKTNKLKCIVDYNKNKKSIISGFISINLTNYCIHVKDTTLNKEIKIIKTFDIPVKISNTYHGKLTDYKKEKDKALYIYTIKFDEKNKQVKILLCKDGIREYPVDKHNYVGIDVNIKHNLFSLSNGLIYDFDRDLVKEYLHELNKIDKLKEQNKDYKPGKRRLFKLDVYKRSIKSSNQRIIVEVCKDLQKQNIDHIVLENLTQSFKKSRIKNDEYKEKYNGISRILNTGSLKDEFKHIACKYGIQVSFIHAEYTSQMCPVCGAIHEENRYDQEHFECIECGHTDNADHNASINIKNRVSEPCFLNLLKQNIDGSYIPKKISHDKLKEKIHQCVMQLFPNRK